MIARCYNPKHPRFADYGGRGITVCERWLTFANFLADMGEPPPGLTLDRIDNDGNYEPGNCRWATDTQQRTNKRPRKLNAEDIAAIRVDTRTQKAIAYPMHHFLMPLNKIWASGFLISRPHSATIILVSASPTLAIKNCRNARKNATAA